MLSSIAYTYILASRAKDKLTKEASKTDLDLRILVCHANLLDYLTETIQERRLQPISDIKLDDSKPIQDDINDEQTTETIEEVSETSWDEVDQEPIISVDDKDVDYEDYESENEYSDNDSSSSYSSDYNSDSENEYDNEGELEEESRNTLSRYRSMPTIDELSEDEQTDIADLYDTVFSDSEDLVVVRSNLLKPQTTEHDEEHEEEVDGHTIERAPSLNYYSSEEEYSDSDEEHHEAIDSRVETIPIHKPHHHHKYHHNHHHHNHYSVHNQHQVLIAAV